MCVRISLVRIVHLVRCYLGVRCVLVDDVDAIVVRGILVFNDNIHI